MHTPPLIADAEREDLPTAHVAVGLILCFLAMLADGFDLAVMPLTMPAIATEWQLLQTASFGTIFSAGLVGIMLGAPLLGSVADRIGRKGTFISSLVFIGLSTLAITQVENVPQLIAARFATGIGIGGALPLGIVIGAELVQPAMRARTIATVSTGATVGAALCGFAGSWLIPAEGWRSMFFVGGMAPIIIAGLAAFFLPIRTSRQSASALGGAAAQDQHPPQSTAFGLFRGALAVKTPLLWLLFCIIGLTIYFIQSWSPILFTAKGYSSADVAIAMGLFGSFGAVGGLLIGWPVDWFGIRPLTILFLLAVPVLAGMALMSPSTRLLWGLMAAIGLLFFSAQVAVNSIATQIYPAGTRAKGIGWGLGTVRLGQLAGAYGGGLLLEAGLGVPTLFGVLAGIAGAATFTSILLDGVNKFSRFGLSFIQSSEHQPRSGDKTRHM